MSNGFASVLERVKRGDLPLSGLVSQESVDAACLVEGYRSQASLYTPITTILTFLAQLLGADRSCQQAVDGLIAEQVAQGKKGCSTDTGGYCKARARLPEQVYWRLAVQAGREIEREGEESWLWLGHRVLPVDGSTLQIADTPENRREYPLQKNLKPGLHYPVVRILVVFSLAVGTVLQAAISPYKGKGTGETAMLRAMTDLFQPGDVQLVDRCYAGYWDVAYWIARGVHVVVRNSASRKSDFRRGKQLGPNDHLITWKKTARPDWIDAEAAAQVPSTLELREVCIVVRIPGFRTRKVIVITTLTDPKKYTVDELANLYRRRWQAELQLRSLKTHMGMKQLRCKKPEMLRKEFALYLLAYNCIRRVGAEAAREKKLEPYEISFKHTQQTINEFFPRLHQSHNLNFWIEQLLHTVAGVIVGNRPDRIEPYTCKTRPQDFPAPKETRTSYKKRKAKTG
jgi:DDE family transposase